MSFEFLLRQAAEPSEELCAKAHCELFNFELVEELQFIGEIINEQECKHRRLWRLAVATHPRTQAN